jgi:hypothetical protein
MHFGRKFHHAFLLAAFLLSEMVHSACPYDGGLEKSTCGGYPSEFLIADFDKKPRNVTRLGGVLQNYFFPFEDHAFGGTSRILGGAVRDEKYPNSYMPVFNENSGLNDSRYGFFLEFEIGEQLVNNLSRSVKNPGFAGIGFNVYDSSSASYWNEKIEHFPHFYFDYLCSGDFQELTLEVHDYFDVCDSKESNRQPIRGAGVVWHKHLPPTGTAWKRALISLDSLTIHTSSEGQSPLPLDRTRLSKFLFKVYGEKGEKGKIAIDNLYFGDGAKVQTTVPDVKSIVRNGISFLQKNGIIFCKSTVPFGYSDIQANIYSLVGKAVFTGMFKKSSSYELSIKIPDIPAGRYFLTFKMNGNFQSNERTIPIIISK